MAQKNAFEAFANALLHSVSPFMLPLRERCKTSLPHIKVDQRFGKSGQPQTAVAQFVVAPLVTNYRPRHFHDLTPGDLMEFHYDFAQVIKQLKSASDILFGYGPVWKRYAVPYCYVSCKDYRQEVLNLCPDEVPNMRVEAIYEDDIVKDITDVVLAVEELEPLQSMSIAQAMSRRVNLAPLFDAFDTIFKPIENYRIIIRDLHRAPSTYLIQASHHEIQQKPSPLVLYNDPNLWYELPVVSRIRVEEKTTEEAAQHPAADTAATAASAKAAGGESKAGATSRNDRGLPAERGSHGKRSSPGEMYPLAVVVPVVGSVLCVLLTACILWRRRSTA
ncbi:putative transmembrane transport protein [Trypanosoma conorhini]|uniref:Putative transmembrane transport protein n=1 Tax=Trypanosoma conorhini TaxID=83891 RepID=A0A3R7L8F9_9TRYP|nr:putative transmembrane transport protein [Trypanosoma conorhini]RNF18282.1 putative transmembrane transport protein [Trypanosoma conorhini]